MGGLSYSDAGVDTSQAATELRALAQVLKVSASYRTGAGESVLENGYYASAIRINDDLALGICTDGVGSKILVAEQLGKFDTIGIDCVAMNVNDLICIGAEPLCLVDYIAVEGLPAGRLAEVAEGLLEGARLSRISIPGGETAQLPEMIRGAKAGEGLDLVGTAVGLAPMDRLDCGAKVVPGDVVVGLASSGVHSNGFTLARRALFEAGGLAAESHVNELGATAGAALLEPTRIYVRAAMEMWTSGLDIHAMCHITGDGLLNLNRVAAEVGFVLDALPDAQPVFDLIARTGRIEPAEMYTVFNMGVGLCVVVPEAEADRVCEIAARHETDAQVIGRAVAGPKRVELPQHALAGAGASFAPVS